MGKQSVVCYKEISIENCVQYIAGNYNALLKVRNYTRMSIFNE
jgi:hypothetical protein